MPNTPRLTTHPSIYTFASSEVGIIGSGQGLCSFGSGIMSRCIRTLRKGLMVDLYLSSNDTSSFLFLPSKFIMICSWISGGLYERRLYIALVQLTFITTWSPSNAIGKPNNLGEIHCITNPISLV